MGPSWSWSYGRRIYNYLCNQCPSPLMLWVRIPLMARCTWYNINNIICRTAHASINHIGGNRESFQFLVFFFVLCLVPNVVNVSGLSIFDCPSDFSRLTFILKTNIQTLLR